MDYKTMKKQVEWAGTLKSQMLTINQQETILKFTLLFNVFEARLFINGMGVSSLLRRICIALLTCEWFDVKDYDEYGKFFSDRYVDNEGTYRDRNLGLSANDKPIVINAIKEFKRGNYAIDLFLSYLLIAYRFRNNLFHGEKDVLGLNRYDDCFKRINELMYKLLSDMISNEFDGLMHKY